VRKRAVGYHDSQLHRSLRVEPRAGMVAPMQKPELPPTNIPTLQLDLLRSGRDALANDVLRQLPKSEAEFRALVARRPVLMAAVAAAAGCAAMQLVLTVLRREPRTAPQTRDGHHWLGVATALWPFVRRTASPT
jgi:hypothetical protein